ncbi:Chromosomal replication initiator protein DnaA 1 [Neochlamydia sp. EPS4]|nr:Chromosomal replication initiator protein DnaA 1 [Neochlamydia sp. EPS4]
MAGTIEMHAWNEFLALQEIELGSETVHKWLKSLRIIRFDAANLYLEAKDSFQALWFEEHMRQKILTKFVNNNNKKIKVHLSVANSLPRKAKSSSLKSAALSSHAPFALCFDELDPYCTFEHYVSSEKNILVEKLLLSLAHSGPSKELGTFNPIFIHGSSGAGKTHLLMATAQALRSQGLHVLYSRAETFTEHVVSAIRVGEMSIFRQAYRNSDVLIIDGVQEFSKKGATQEEFFHTFNTLHLDNKQIILSANCSPAELTYIEPRLVSRFEWGVVLNLFPLSKEELALAIRKKAQFFNFPLHAKIIEFLLDNFPSSSKALIRALEALVLRSHLNEQMAKHSTVGITVPIAKQILSDLLIEEKQYVLTPDKIIKSIAEIFGIKAEDILGKAQSRDCVFPRQLAMYLCRQTLQMPFTKIGDIFSKDHSTVMSSVRLIKKGMEMNDKDIISAYQSIQKKIDFNEPKS